MIWSLIDKQQHMGNMQKWPVSKLCDILFNFEMFNANWIHLTKTSKTIKAVISLGKLIES